MMQPPSPEDERPVTPSDGGPVVHFPGQMQLPLVWCQEFVLQYDTGHWAKIICRCPKGECSLLT